MHCAGIAHPFQWGEIAIAHPYCAAIGGAQSYFQEHCALTPLRSLLPCAADGACAHGLTWPPAAAVSPSLSVQPLLCSDVPCGMAAGACHRRGLLLLCPPRAASSCRSHTAYPNFEVIMELLFLQLRTFAHRLKPKYFTDCAPNCAPFKVSEEC